MALVYDLFDQANALAKSGDDQGAVAGFASLAEGLAEATGVRATKLSGAALYNMGNALSCWLSLAWM